jgi:hypothetical protein
MTAGRPSPLLGVIVEGHGDVNALPTLLRRLIPAIAPTRYALLERQPHRVARGKLVQEHELRRAVDFVARKVGDGGAVLLVLDADRDCPARLGPRLLDWARDARPDRALAVTIAKVEFEAWFLAAAASLAGCEGLPATLAPPPDPEAIRNAKGWLGAQMPRGYQETLHQDIFARRFDLESARAAPSFEKLVRDIARLLQEPVPATLYTP